MSEIRFQLEWTDGQISTLSPSTVFLDYFQPSDSLLVSEFELRGVEALREASECVPARYVFACTCTNEKKYQLSEWITATAPMTRFV